MTVDGFEMCRIGGDRGLDGWYGPDDGNDLEEIEWHSVH